MIVDTTKCIGQNLCDFIQNQSMHILIERTYTCMHWIMHGKSNCRMQQKKNNNNKKEIIDNDDSCDTCIYSSSK